MENAKYIHFLNEIYRLVLYFRNDDNLYVRTVLIVIAVILGLGIYFRLTILEYQSYKNVQVRH